MATNNAGDIATGVSGTVLQGQGVGTKCAFSTATYPSTAGSTGTFLVSDGTNIVNRDIGNLQFSTKVSLTNAQLKSFGTTPVEIIPAPGAGFIISPVYVNAVYTYGGNNPFTGASTVNLYYGNKTFSLGIVFSNGTMTGTASRYFRSVLGNILSTTTNQENMAVTIAASGADFAGNAANDNTMTIQIWYFIFPV